MPESKSRTKSRSTKRKSSPPAASRKRPPKGRRPRGAQVATVAVREKARAKARAPRGAAARSAPTPNDGLNVERALAKAAAATSGQARAGGAPSIGVARVPADPWGDGYDLFRIRADLVDGYTSVRQRIVAGGGIVTSSGGLRAVTEPATPGRSKTSLHYTARAIDLNVSSGMQARRTPYVVVRDGGSDDHPLWKVYCEVTADGEGETRALEALVWKRGQGVVATTTQVRCICLTDMFEEGGWRRIPARSGWRDNYMSCEWWHFQNETGLVSGVSLFGDELKKVWPADDVDRSGLALNAVWANQSFVIPAA
jgi:hypothetical protein